MLLVGLSRYICFFCSFIDTPKVIKMRIPSIPTLASQGNLTADPRMDTIDKRAFYRVVPGSSLDDASEWLPFDGFRLLKNGASLVVKMDSSEKSTLMDHRVGILGHAAPQLSYDWTGKLKHINYMIISHYLGGGFWEEDDGQMLANTFCLPPDARSSRFGKKAMRTITIENATCVQVNDWVADASILGVSYNVLNEVNVPDRWKEIDKFLVI